MKSSHDLNADLGVVVAERRAELGNSREKLALISGLDRTFVGKIESGMHSPSLNSLFNLSEGLQLAPEELVRRVHERSCRRRSPSS